MLSADDLAAIEAAVRQAETGTRGEIYCVSAARSSDYAEVPLAWAAGAALLAPAVLLLGGVRVSLPDLTGGWDAGQVGEVAETAARVALGGTIVLQMLIFVVVLLVGQIPAVHRWLTPRRLMRQRVRRRAEELFLAKGIHATRERTGVLIYVSQAERLAELVADDAIHAKVAQSQWDQAMAALTDGLRRGVAGEGFVAAIRFCGDLLARHFPAYPTDNPNELSDSVVVVPDI